jgi:NAD(P)-dependent dehydrogenase (short-subunit alcohol dehydrogenase family)
MATLLITGSNRGIGLALASEALARGHTLHATHRTTADTTQLSSLASKFPGRLHCHALDINNDADLAQLADSLKASGTCIDILINNAGVMSPNASDFGSIDRDSVNKGLATNATAPLMVTQALQPLMLASSQPLVVMISSSLASIGARIEPTDWKNFAYNASKAALNMVGRMLHLEFTKTTPQIGVLLLHPGWVRTDMGGEEAPLSTEQSASALMDRIEGFKPEHSGNFFDPHGQILPW